MDETILSLLRKVKELADRGVDGERDAAIGKLAALMKKYRIRPEDIEAKEPDVVRFKYRTVNQKILGVCLAQVCCGRRDVPCRILPKKTILIYMTKAEKKEWSAIYAHYLLALKKDEEMFIAAFLHRNQILPPTGGAGKEMSPEDTMAVMRMMAYMQSTPYQKIGTLIGAYSDAH